MEDTDFDLLCKGLSADEARRLRKIFVEWCDGDENGFPVQLALLTLAQWRAAALVPQAVNESRKLIDLHLAEYRRQTKAMIDDFSSTAGKQTVELQTAMESHAKTTEQATKQIRVRLDDAERVVRQIKSLMESAASEWKGIKSSTTAQCTRLEQITDHLDSRFAWRVLLTALFWFSLAIVLGAFLGHYCWGH